MKKTDESGVSPVIAVILMVAITVVLAGVLYVWVSNLTKEQPKIGDILQLEVKNADADVNDVLFYLRHQSGAPIDLKDYIIQAGPEGRECAISLTDDVRSSKGLNSTWDNTTKTISVNQRVYFSPSCIGIVDDGTEIHVLLIDRETNDVVWEGNCRVYDF